MTSPFNEDCPGGPPPLGDRPLVVVAAVALVDPDGRLLIAQRPEGKSMAGLWEFPGGKVDGRETPEEALVRELHEELGIEIGAIEPWRSEIVDYEHARVRRHFCEVYDWHGEFELR